MKLVHPMLAGDPEGKFEAILFPIMVSPKIDGIRATVQAGKLLSRNHKPIGNDHIRSMLEHSMFEGFDGELVVGAAYDDPFLRTTGAVRRKDGKPDFRFHVFDICNMPGVAFKDRRRELGKRLSLLTGSCATAVPHTFIGDPDLLNDLEQTYVETGYEGVMTNNPASFYKEGRATMNKRFTNDNVVQALLKIKRFSDAEAVVVGFEEQQANTNEATKDLLGRTKRSTHAAGKVGKGTLGKLIVKALNGPYKGKTFPIGTGKGWTDAWRAEWWAKRAQLPGMIVKHKFFLTGALDAPRFPIGLLMANKEHFDGLR